MYKNPNEPLALVARIPLSVNRKKDGKILTRPEEIDYKKLSLLKRYLSDGGRIAPARNNNHSLKVQRALKKAVKRARFLAFLPYVSKG